MTSILAFLQGIRCGDFLGISVVLVLLGGAGAARAQNLVVNPGFDDDLAGWSTFGSGTIGVVMEAGDQKVIEINNMYSASQIPTPVFG